VRACVHACMRVSVWYYCDITTVYCIHLLVSFSLTKKTVVFQVFETRIW